MTLLFLRCEAEAALFGAVSRWLLSLVRRSAEVEPKERLGPLRLR
jgi:hypothetical protein